MKPEIPNPGSDAAIKSGCTCPALDNHHGRGAWRDPSGKPMFWTVMDCPLHGVKVKEEKK